MTRALYIHGVMPADTAAPAAAPMLPDSPVTALAQGGLSVLASRVQRTLFDAADPANRTGDPDWMAERVRACHAIAAAAAAAGPFLPLAFGTLFSSLDRLDAWLTPRAGALTEALAGIAGRQEFRLALHPDAAAHAAWLDRHDPGLGRLAAARAAAGPGTAFLMARRLEGARTAAALAHRTAVAERVAGVLSKLDGVAVIEAEAAAWTLVAVPDFCRAPLAELATEIGGSGLDLRLTGPWPAYGFARHALPTEVAHA